MNVDVNVALELWRGARAAIERVRKLHEPDEVLGTATVPLVCRQCTIGGPPIPYPCPTIRALDEDGAA